MLQKNINIKPRKKTIKIGLISNFKNSIIILRLYIITKN
jgi:hypothetical protein